MKMFKRMISLVLALSIILSLNPAVAKADSSYSMITPGYSVESAAVVPTDGKDYVASIDSAETENLYFMFDVPQNAETFYTITYKNLSVDGYTSFAIESTAGEVLFKSNDYMRVSDSYVLSRKLEGGCYILKVHNREGKTGNVKVNVATRKDKIGDDQASAATIKVGTAVTGSLDGYHDNDYYKFVAPAKGTYEFYGKNLSIDEWGYFGVYSSSEEEMYSCNYMNKNNEGSCAIKCEKGDVYYLRYAYHNHGSDVPAVGNYKVYVKKVEPGKVKSVKVKKKNGWNNIYVSWSKASGCTGYEMQISTSKKFKTYDSYTTSDKNYSVYRSKGTYYIRVRSYKQIGSTKYYGSFSSTKKITVK